MRKGNSIRFEVPRFPSTVARDLQDSAGKCEREDGREGRKEGRTEGRKRLEEMENPGSSVREEESKKRKKKKYEPEAEINSKSYMRV